MRSREKGSREVAKICVLGARLGLDFRLIIEDVFCQATIKRSRRGPRPLRQIRAAGNARSRALGACFYISGSYAEEFLAKVRFIPEAA